MDGDRPTPTRVDRGVTELIEQADLICYPMGSFYTSLIVNLLPAGVARAIAENPCPKVYVPSLGNDPEQRGKSVAACAGEIILYLQRGTKSATPADQFLNLLLVDRKYGRYDHGLDVSGLKLPGVRIVDTRLCTAGTSDRYDDVRLLHALLSLT